MLRQPFFGLAFFLFLSVACIFLPSSDAVVSVSERRAYGWLDRQCIDGGFKPTERRSLPAGAFGNNAKNLTLGMSPCCWSAQELPTWIAKIILEEVLGLHVDIAGVADIQPAALGIVGCLDYEDWQCSKHNTTNPVLHVVLGVFYPDMVTDVEHTLDVSSGGPGRNSWTNNVRDIGPIGFGSVDADFVMQGVVADAKNKKQLDLQWGPNLAHATEFFTQLVDFNGSHGIYQYCAEDYADLLLERGYLCNSTWVKANPWRKGLLAFDGKLLWDENGDSPGRPIPARNCSSSPIGSGNIFPGWVCILDGWWASPACQKLGDPEKSCIVYADFGSGSAWSPTVVQTWEELNIPILYVCTGPGDVHMELLDDFSENGNRILFNWWAPDASSELKYHGSATKHVVAPRRVSYPPGKGAASGPSHKIARQELLDLAPEVMFLLERLLFTPAHMERLHQQLVNYVVAHDLKGYEAQDEAYFNVTCEWVRNNRLPDSSRKGGRIPWGPWVMTAEQCQPGKEWHPSTASCISCAAGSTSRAGVGCYKCPAGVFCPQKALQNRACVHQGNSALRAQSFRKIAWKALSIHILELRATALARCAHLDAMQHSLEPAVVRTVLSERPLMDTAVCSARLVQLGNMHMAAEAASVRHAHLT
eukprot:TRINITY_DN6111_c0_g2_i1.p1 TRINITY_DN6111_c0_g2~~TRINITY_DN6111_c0_g2_i1.p1  ORF type:complete len:646 (-),score=83.80 TRINITY_DN6111_c0_g2_i1:1548-3485(-)